MPVVGAARLNNQHGRPHVLLLLLAAEWLLFGIAQSASAKSTQLKPS